MNTTRFEFKVGKTYEVSGGYSATVIKRTEKTVTFRVVYYYCRNVGYHVWEEIVKKKIFMSGCEETSFIEFTKDKNDVDFCNAYDEFGYDKFGEELFQAIERVEKKLKENTQGEFNDLLTHVQIHYVMEIRNMRNGWRYYAEAYLCELVREIIFPLYSLSQAIVCCRRDNIINEYLNSFSEERINKFFNNLH